NGRQQIGGGDDVVSAAQILAADLLDESWDIDTDRAALDTGRIGTEQTALSFVQRVFEAKDVNHLLEVLGALARILLAYGSTFLRNGTYRLLLGHLTTFHFFKWIGQRRWFNR